MHEGKCMKKIVLCLCLLLSMGALTGCSGDKEELVEKSYEDDNGYMIHRRGEKVTLGDWEITYKSSGASEKTEESSVYVNVIVKNISKEKKTFTKSVNVTDSSVQSYIVNKEYSDVEGYSPITIIDGNTPDITD